VIEIIREHNQLSGLRLIVALYGAIAAGLGLLSAYYLAAGRAVDAAV
jgi:hypothetical protein